MKHLLNGVAMAAALAIAAPVWAQNAPMTPSSPPPPPPAAAPASPPKAAPTPPPSMPSATPTGQKPMAQKPPAKPMKHMVMHHKPTMNAGDQMTEDLNKQELARIQSGSPPSMAAPSPGGNNPTSGTAGPFAPPPPPK